MKKLGLTLILWLLGGFAYGQSVTIPSEVKVPVGRLAAVTVSYDGDDFRYAAPADLDCFREYDPDPKKVRLRLIGYAPGKYQLFAVACKGGKLSEFAVCNVIVGEPPPPGPIPPVPVPPGPVDPLLGAIQEAFNQDRVKGLGTVEEVKTLAAVYRQGVTVLDGFTGTAGQFYAAVSDTGRRAVPLDRLPAFRRKLADEVFNKNFPRDESLVLDAATKAIIRDKLNATSSLVLQVK